ncbi:uncharacterized protein DS421_5g136170 [Arachis hypogaea]|nr:uncharacterized protein DS421_5g136170 [Arachis hypogaea]
MAQTKIILALILLASALMFHYYYSSFIDRNSGLDSAEDDDEANMWCLPPPLEQLMPPLQLAVRLPSRHLHATVFMDFGQQSMVLVKEPSSGNDNNVQHKNNMEALTIQYGSNYNKQI